ncbi:mucolipin-3-like [Ylistrum balloti]|uniref:mucolipin-3-like n=1 Tax=Ylistrum balloti TaxID=509963 RepID=UPI0029058916|nr:mucolipin-3-like [Ylistrum balloti]
MNAEQTQEESPVRPARQKHIAAADVKDVSVNLYATDDVSDASTSQQHSDGVKEVSASAKNEIVNVQQETTTEESRWCCDWKKTQEDLRIQLVLHFSHTMARCWRNKKIYKKIPSKMLLLIVNVILVTLQLIIFANERSHFATFLNRNNIALRHLLLKNWSKDYETMPYPPTTGTYAVYTIDDLKDHVEYAVNGIHSLPTKAVGTFLLNANNSTVPLRICATYFKSGVFNSTFDPPVIKIDRTRETQCKDVGANTTNYGLHPSLDDLITSENGVLVRLLELTLDFSISSIHVDMRREERPPECFEIIGRVTFDNYEIHGQIPVTLTTSINGFECEGESANNGGSKDIPLVVLVIVANLLSIIASVRSFVTSCILWLEVKHFFQLRAQQSENKEHKPLSKRGSWEILRFRDVMLVISGLLTILGSFIKIRYDVGQLATSESLDACGILLGLGCLMLWMLSLHYLAFNKVFSLLFLVLDRSATSILRFLVCIFVMYFGFALCGWAVLGPYHLKFLSFTATFQCLLALMNGDEVYVTMTAVDEESQVAYWFNVIFITLFIFLFTIITLNVFIAIYNTTYEDIMEGKNKSDLMTFIGGESEVLLYSLNCEACTKVAPPIFDASCNADEVTGLQ